MKHSLIYGNCYLYTNGLFNIKFVYETSSIIFRKLEQIIETLILHKLFTIFFTYTFSIAFSTPHSPRSLHISITKMELFTTFTINRKPTT